MNAIWHSATSKAPSAKGRWAASPLRHSISGRTRRATSSIASFRSSPTTRPRPRWTSATVRATMPVPHATSRTRWPGAAPASSVRRGAHSAKRAGTNCDSYSSAAAADSLKVSFAVSIGSSSRSRVYDPLVDAHHDAPSGSHVSSSGAVTTLARPSEPLARASGALAQESTGETPGIDPLSDVLRAIRLTGAVFFRVDATSPWVIEMPDSSALASVTRPRSQHVISYHVVTEGACWGALL